MASAIFAGIVQGVVVHASILVLANFSQLDDMSNTTVIAGSLTSS